MEPQHTQTGIWAESWRVLMLNVGPFAFYVAALVVVAGAAEWMDNSGGSTVAQIFAAAVLAIPAHLTVLKGMSGFESMKGSTVLMPFVLRTIGLGALALVLPLALLIFLIAGTISMFEAIAAFGILALILGSAVFAKWGTMLPAAVMNADKSFAAAGRRGGLVFGYAFPRLLISFGVLTLLQLVSIFGLMYLFPSATGEFFPEGGGLGIVSIVALTLACAVGAYQVVMTAVILSRSFQKAEASSASS